MKNLFLLLLPIITFLGCGDNQTRKICGKWQTVAVTEEGEVVNMDLSAMKFEFQNNGIYNYKSTQDYIEAGSFSIQGDLLYTLDTINKASSEKAVRILKLTRDSLLLQMMAGSKERIFSLAKIR
jgi:hypothetical protein